MCCSVLQCVAVCCSVLQCGAVCCSVVQCGAVWCSVVQCGARWCSLVQCVVVCLSMVQVWQFGAVCCSVLQCVAVCCRHYHDTCLMTLCAELTAKQRFVSAKKQCVSAKGPSYYARKILCVKEAQKERVYAGGRKYRRILDSIHGGEGGGVRKAESGHEGWEGRK